MRVVQETQVLGWINKKELSRKSYGKSFKGVLGCLQWRLVRREGLSSLFAIGKSDAEILCEVAVLMFFERIENLTVQKRNKITVWMDWSLRFIETQKRSA